MTVSPQCCMSGCAVCVYDLYDEARNDYIQAVDNIRANLDKMGVPEDEWPPDLRRKQPPPEPSARPDVILSAFEQLEKQLREKKERERREARSRAWVPALLRCTDLRASYQNWWAADEGERGQGALAEAELENGKAVPRPNYTRQPEPQMTLLFRLAGSCTNAPPQLQS
ncbi:hypothetical protein NUW54_g14729 [Trametes sanguinea]|uniref:Uncharacterized protein n=1 Tax=Trametes sanguinea TaxID=158606 RepID=A0ACC1MBJ1_9APHY|nr:hypothetical protein NUW54_g14729 [Trametes sanguinea]